MKVALAIERHKNDETVQDQRRRSGNEQHKSGLTYDEKQTRAAREEARSNFAYGADLNRRMEMAKGMGKSKGRESATTCFGPLHGT